MIVTSMIVGLNNFASDRVGMIVVVGIDAQRRDLTIGKQGKIFRMFGDIMRRAGTAHMVVEAHHAVGGGHDQMQIMADHQNAAAKPAAQLSDQIVQAGLSDHVETLRRFVEDQQLGIAKQRTAQQHALHFAAGNALQRLVEQSLDANIFERFAVAAFGDPTAQIEKAAHRQR